MTRALPVFVLALAVFTGGCGKQRVTTQPDMPPLAPPSPPPRVVSVPVEPEEPAPEARVPELPPRKPSRPTTRTPEPLRELPKAEPPKPAAPPEQAPPKEEQPATTLQIQPPGGQLEAERKARRLLDQAWRDLGNVNVRALNADARGQYDQAKRFVDQGRQALKEQNFVLAELLAEKAATIASVLVGR